MGRTSDAKERLMAAALDLSWEQSYGAITIDDICQRAEVKKGSFYYFFESKSDLAIAALERLWLEVLKPGLDAQFSPSVAPLQRITQYLESIFEKQSAGKSKSGRVLGCPLCSLGTEVSTQDEKLGAKVREIFGRKKRYFESAIRDAVAEGAIEPCDPVEKVRSVGSLIEGVMVQSRIMNDPEMVRRLPAMVLDLLRPKTAVPASAAN
jgi:TetR/AcrR family transcriptional regulator, transcriptional repressor for nem operon